MQLNCEKTCDQSQQSNHQRAEDLKKNITFTNTQLHKLVSNEQKFLQRIKQLNKNAIKQINNQSFDEAIVYLAEAERNLEYAASCGMSIDRILIITTLKNLACGYQRLWQLATCYDYIEALILNLSIQNDDYEKLLKNELIKDKSSSEYERLSRIAGIKLKLAISYLQFSALSSQLGKHEEANKNVHKSLGEFKVIIEICHAYQLLVKGKTSILLESIRSSIELKGDELISKKLVEARRGLQKIKEHVYFFCFDSAVIEKVSMGDIMQIKCTSVEEAASVEGVTWFISQIGLTYMSIYISCCFFALATEIRLAIPEGDRLKVEHHPELETAKLYHLCSIILASQFVLIESNYLNHIVKSFKNNFHVDLVEEEYQIESSCVRSTHLGGNEVKQSALKCQTITFKTAFEEKKSDEGIQVNMREGIKNKNRLKRKKEINQQQQKVIEIKKLSSKKNIFIENNKQYKNRGKNCGNQKSMQKNEKKSNNKQIIYNYFNRIKNIKKYKKNEQIIQKNIQNEYYINKLQISEHKKKLFSPSLSSRQKYKVNKKLDKNNKSKDQKFKEKIKIIKSNKLQ